MRMSVVVGRALRDQLGDEATRGLTDYVERTGDVWRTDVVQVWSDRMDARTQHLDERFNQIVAMLADAKADILRWSFAFWLGQTLVTIALLGLVLRFFRP